MRCSQTTENNNKQSDKKEIDILTNNQDSMITYRFSQGKGEAPINSFFSKFKSIQTINLYSTIQLRERLSDFREK